MFLQINNLEKFYGEKDNRVQVLKGLSTGIGKGEICVLLGPSGSGKSTLLNIIGGIKSYDKGEIIINDAAMSAMNEKQLKTSTGNTEIPSSSLHTTMPSNSWQTV